MWHERVRSDTVPSAATSCCFDVGREREGPKPAAFVDEARRDLATEALAATVAA